MTINCNYVLLLGWTAVNCTKDIDECGINPGPCYNNGVCINMNGTFDCNCTDNFTGNLIDFFLPCSSKQQDYQYRSVLLE